MRKNIHSWLVLSAAYVSVRELLRLEERFGDVNAITEQTEAALTAAGLAEKKARAVTSPHSRQIETAENWLNDERHHLLHWGSDDYPELLTQLAGPPLTLFVNGDIDTLHLPALAVVGSRNPTRGGLQNSFDFARHLAASGYAIISGLAEGIDTAAHQGAMSAAGKTLALLGHGIDRVYPASNRQLAHDVAANGALISEYPLGTAPNKRHFPERNRLISGLALGTLVIEAARRSGSLITARLAAEQGREVFALPGSIHNPLARGCHELIRQGAKLVETGSDITAELAPVVGHLQQTAMESRVNTESANGDDEDYAALRLALGHDPSSIDELQQRSGLTAAQLSSMLLILELHGDVESLPGGQYALIA